VLLMLNPLRSESDAFRFLLYVIAVFGAIIAIIVRVLAGAFGARCAPADRGLLRVACC
jgi:hypothetical protein